MSSRRVQLVPWLLFGLPLVWAALSGLVACHAPAVPEAPKAQAGPEIPEPSEGAAASGLDLEYEFRRTASGVEVHASAECRAGETVWELPQSWGGNDAPDRDLGALRARDEHGQALALEQRAPHQWVVRSDRAGRQTVSYTLPPNELLRSGEHTDHYRPLVGAELFHALGGRTILVPSSVPRERELDVALTWTGFDSPGWNVASSFGCGAREQRFRARAQELQHAVYVGGELALERREVRGSAVWVAVHGRRWASPIPEFADLAARVVEAQRAFFDDWDYPSYLISLVEAGPDDGRSQSMGGTALHDSFAMFLTPGTALAPSAEGGKRVLNVLAHEMFHHWCGGAITPESPEELSYWFTEGFTDYFTRRLLWRSGLYDRRDFEERLNEKLASYYASPVRTEPAERIRRDFWNDAAVSSLPYQRGDAIAIELDFAIRKASGGERTIDDWMRALFARCRELGRPFTRDELFASIAEFSDAETAERLEAVALDGALLAPRVDWFAPCLAHVPAHSGSFELGFDFEAARSERVIRGLVAGSAAERAGLREGDGIAGLSLAPGDATHPVRMTLRGDDGPREVEFLPCSATIEVPSYRFQDGADCGPASGL